MYPHALITLFGFDTFDGVSDEKLTETVKDKMPTDEIKVIDCTCDNEAEEIRVEVEHLKSKQNWTEDPKRYVLLSSIDLVGRPKHTKEEKL